MTKVCSFLSLLRIFLVELSPGSLSLAELLEYALVSLLLIKVRVFVNLLTLIYKYSINILQSLRIA